MSFGVGGDTLYNVGEEEYSPTLEGSYPDVAELVPPVVCHKASPLDASSPLDAAVIPRPPDPAIGGKRGAMRQLGWTTGLRNSRAFRQPFDGRTLVVPSMGAHPIAGPVGFSTRTDRLSIGAKALTANPTPSDADVSAMFGDPDAAAIVAATRDNPNYG